MYKTFSYIIHPNRLYFLVSQVDVIKKNTLTRKKKKIHPFTYL